MTSSISSFLIVISPEIDQELVVVLQTKPQKLRMS